MCSVHACEMEKEEINKSKKKMRRMKINGDIRRRMKKKKHKRNGSKRD